MKTINRRVMSGVMVACAVLAASQATAQTVIDWTGGAANDSYNSVFNWAGLNIPNNTTESARFNLAGTFDVTIQSGLTQMVSDLIVDAGNINFTSNGAIFATFSLDDDVLVSGGDLTLSSIGGSSRVLFNVADDVRVSGGSTLRLDGGSDLNTMDLFAGRDVSGDGTVVVDGAGSVLNVSNSVIFGANGRIGTLTIQNGSTSNQVDDVLILVLSGQTGSTGRLNVLSGSDLTTADILVGSQSSSASAAQEATLTVDGVGSVLTMAGAATLTVGDATNPNIISDVLVNNLGVLNTGTGLTLIQNSGEVRSSTDGVVNFNGDITVDGGLLRNNNFPSNGSEITFTAGSVLMLQNGGRFSELATRTFTGMAVNIDGVGSRWDGGNGTVDGVLNVTTGGVAFMDVSFKVANQGNGNVAADGNGSTIRSRGVRVADGGNTGTMTFTNGAVGDFNDSSSNTFFIANSSTAGTTGTLMVASGADVFTNNLSIAAVGGATTTGTATLTGLGSTLTQDNNMTLVVGHATDGTATLNVNSASVFSTGGGTGTTTVNATGTISIDNGAFNANGDLTVDAGSLNVTNGGSFILAAGKTLTLQNNGNVGMVGSFDIDNGATLMIVGGGDFISSDTLNMGVGATGTNGTLVVDGLGSRLEVDAGFFTPTMTWGANGGTANVTLSNNASSDFLNLNIATSSVAGTTANVLIESGGDVIFENLRVADVGGLTTTAQITVTGNGSRLSPAFTGSTLADVTIGNNLGGSAQIDINDNGVFATGAGSTNIYATGRVTVNGGRFESETNVILNRGTLELLDGTVAAEAITVVSDGSFDFVGGRLGVIDFQGTLTNQGGVLAPGELVGTTVVSGYNQQVGGMLEIGIGGTTPGTGFDRLIVTTGNAFLNGKLDLQPSFGFTPVLGDTFLIVDVLNGSRFGAFASVLGADLGSGLGFDVIYSSSGVMLEIVSNALAGDLDGDGFVGIADLNIVLGNWNQNVPPGNPLADPSGDGFVGIADLNVVLGNWNAGTPPGTIANIPEPGTLVVLALGGLVLMRRDAD
jgi:T5SS/PEP-CTERM-associated repeat protein